MNPGPKSEPESEESTSEPELVALYDESLPYVYGYLLSRCGNVSTAEDLTSETFLAAADAVHRTLATPLTNPSTTPSTSPLSQAWLIGVARHKLADHWRRQARESSRIRALSTTVLESEDPWDELLDRDAAWQVLAGLSGQHRCALTLRYVDDLSVADCAEVLGRTLHATEALLTRARSAFRKAYCQPATTATDEEGGHRA
jgi:RNA polymerase sigma-70 factor (ECF subfamily)